MHANFTSLTERIQKLESANSSLKIEIESYAKREKLWNSEKAALINDLATSKELRSVIERDLAALKAAQAQSMTDMLALQNELKRSQDELSRAARSGSSAADDLKFQLERAQTENNAKIAELQKSLENTRATLEREKGNSDKLRAERDEFRKQFADKDAEYKSGILAAKQKESECLIHMNKMRDLQAEIDRLNAVLVGVKAGDKSGELERVKLSLADVNRQLTDAKREVVRSEIIFCLILKDITLSCPCLSLPCRSMMLRMRYRSNLLKVLKHDQELMLSKSRTNLLKWI